MNVLIVGDIHSNLEAFQAVLDDAAARGGFNEVWCLGDIVGYGPDPAACVDLLRRYSPIAVAGNHDRASVGLLGLESFNDYAAFACRWTALNLSEEQIAYLKWLPLVHAQGSSTMVHGSLRDPVWEYLLRPEAAIATFNLLQTSRCLVAHSHIPFICRADQELPAFQRLTEGTPVALGDARLILNPGSVGQPRDGDPNAAYVRYDDTTDTATLHRVKYDISTTQEKMVRAGLPEPLIARLAFGQ